MSDGYSIDLVRARLDRLERWHRRLWVEAWLWRLGALLGLVAVVVLFLRGSLSWPPTAPPDGRFRTVRAKQVVVEDASGRDRAVITMTDDGPELHLLAEDGTYRVVTGAAKAGGTSGFYDKDGKLRIAIGLSGEGRPGVTVRADQDEILFGTP